MVYNICIPQQPEPLMWKRQPHVIKRSILLISYNDKLNDIEGIKFTEW